MWRGQMWHAPIEIMWECIIKAWDNSKYDISINLDYLWMDDSDTDSENVIEIYNVSANINQVGCNFLFYSTAGIIKSLKNKIYCK